MKSNFNLGQHFMVNETAIDRILSHIPKNKKILEIGPGMGALSKGLKKISKELTLIEKDTRFKEHLKDFDVIFGDVLKDKLPEFEVMVSNLAFNIIEPLIMKLIWHDFKSAFLTISATTYAKLKDNQSKFPFIANKLFSIELLEKFEKDVFSPRPRVKAALVKFTPKKEKDLFLEILKKYDQKTKNALMKTFEGLLTKNQVRDMLVNFNPVMLETRIRNLTLRELKKVEAIINETKRDLR